MRCATATATALALLLSGCKPPTPTAADAEKVVREVLADVNYVEPAEVVMDRTIDRPPLNSDTDDMMEALSQLQRRFGVILTDRSVMQVVGVEDIDEAPERLTPDHIVRLVKTALHEQKK